MKDLQFCWVQVRSIKEVQRLSGSALTSSLRQCLPCLLPPCSQHVPPQFFFLVTSKIYPFCLFSKGQTLINLII